MPIARLAAAFLAAFALGAQAQPWPSKPVRIVVAFAAGGSTDVAVRAIQEQLALSLGQPVVVENRAGAAGNIAADHVVKQPADGYTVLASADSLASNPHLFRNLTFDPAKDLAPVVQLTRQPVVLAVHPSLGVSTLAELVAAAKAKPGLGYATSGAGSIQHMAGEWFAQLAGIKLTHVPYKGGGQAITDLVGGQVPIGSLGNTPLLPHHVAPDAALLHLPVHRRAGELLRHHDRDDRRRDQLGVGVLEGRAGRLAVILEDEDVLEARVLLEIDQPGACRWRDVAVADRFDARPSNDECRGAARGLARTIEQRAGVNDDDRLGRCLGSRSQTGPGDEYRCCDDAPNRRLHGTESIRDVERR